MLKNIFIGVLAAALVVAGGSAFYNVVVVDAAGGSLFGNWFGQDTETAKLDALRSIPTSELTEQEATDLFFLAETYRMVSDVEEYAVNKWGLDEFQQMIDTRSELDGQFEILKERYPFEFGSQGVYSDLAIQSAYEISIMLIELDKASAYQGLAYAAEFQIIALTERIGNADNADTQYVYQNLMTQAGNHLRNMAGAFKTESGLEYQAQLMSADMLIGILSGNVGNQGQGFANSNSDPQAASQSDFVPGQGGTFSGQNGNGNQGTSGQSGAGQIGELSTDLITYHGEVVAYEYGTLTLLTDDGITVGVATGNQNYSQSIGFVLTVGESVTVTGYQNPEGLFSAATITLDSSGLVYTFRDESGRPDWAGGNGKGGGQH